MILFTPVYLQNYLNFFVSLKPVFSDLLLPNDFPTHLTLLKRFLDIKTGFDAFMEIICETITFTHIYVYDLSENVETPEPGHPFVPDTR